MKRQSKHKVKEMKKKKKKAVPDKKSYKLRQMHLYFPNTPLEDITCSNTCPGVTIMRNSVTFSKF